MKKIFLTVLAGLMLLLHCAEVKSQNVEVAAKVEKDTVAVASPFTLELSMKAPYGYFVEWANFLDTLSNNIDILKTGEIVRTADADSNILVNQKLTLITFDTGYVTIPSLGLSFAKSLEDPLHMKAYTEPINLYLTSMQVDTTMAYKAIVAPLPAERSNAIYYWIVAVLLVLTIAFVLWYYFRKKKPIRNEDGQIIKGPVVVPYDKAINDLQTLRLQQLWQGGKVKEYYSRMTDIVREYLEGQFRLNAVEMSTEEILDEVRTLRFNQQIFDKLKDTMDLADLVKFAKCNTTPLENDSALNNMTDFVNESHAQFLQMEEQKAKEAAEKALLEKTQKTNGMQEKEVNNV